MTAAAPALPWSWYTDPEVLAAELERVFRPSWHYVGHTADLGASGSWFPGKAGPAPVLVTRDGGGHLRALVAVCRHQGAVINPPAGAGATVRCAYHGWAYRLDGSLASAPGFEGRPGFDPAGRALPELPVGAWGPFVFVAADPAAPPLAGALGALPDRIADRGLDLAELRFGERRRARVAANWKRVVEDFLAGGGPAHLLYPATTIEVLPGRLEIGSVVPAGPEAAERMVDVFTRPGADQMLPDPDGDAAAAFGRRLREELGGR